MVLALTAKIYEDDHLSGSLLLLKGTYWAELCSAATLLSNGNTETSYFIYIVFNILIFDNQNQPLHRDFSSNHAHCKHFR